MSNAVIIKPLPFAAISASSTAVGHSPAYVSNDHMGVVWKSEGGANAQSLLIDLGADMLVDALSLFGCTGAAPSWSMRVQAATAAQGSGFAATVYDGGNQPFLAGTAMPVTMRGRALHLLPAPVSARYWRVTIDGLANGAAVVARAVLGRKIQLERNFSFGGAFGVKDMSSLDFSVRGVLLRRRGVKLRTVALTFSNVYRDEVEKIVHPLIEEIGISEPIALITDPDPDEQRQNRMWFGPLVGDLGTVWAKPGGFEWRASLVGLNA